MKKTLLVFTCFIVVALAWMVSSVPRANAQPGYWTSQNCSICHSDDSVSCNGCHAHGVHTKVAGNDLNLTATTDKAAYAPGETVNVTMDGGNKNGWVRVILYDENGFEITRSSGPGGTGSGAEFPITLSGTAPSTPGTYTFSASWFGNEYDGPTAYFGSNWVSRGNGHGEEIIATNSFTVEGSTGGNAGTNIGVFRKGMWYLDSSGNDVWDNGVDMVMGFGLTTDIPVAGDWNGDGTAEVGVYRDGWWYLDSDGVAGWNASADTAIKFGARNDVPVTGDWDGNGTTDIGVVRDGRTWYLDSDGTQGWNAGSDTVLQYGIPTDIPVTGDWDGDGTTDVGVVRDGWWYLDSDGTQGWNTGTDTVLKFGVFTDTPVTGDWDGDGTTDVGVVRKNVWFLDSNGSDAWEPGTDTITVYGRPTDIPVTGSW